jgi:hypothetical protein
MQPLQVTITLDARESELLRREAMWELRKPRDQARYLLRQALGLTEFDQMKSANQTQNGAGVRQDNASAVL